MEPDPRDVMNEGSARQPRSFEPPPWEREQFEELARQRAEREAIEAEAQRARDEADLRAAEAKARQTRDAPVSVAGAEGVQDAVSAAAPHGDQPPVAAEADVMLIGLAAEEPDPLRYVWLVWLAVAGLFALLGVGTLVLGAVGVARAQGSSVATAWSFVLVVAGLASLGGAVWLTVRALGERGA
jgi:hypothetical protein